MHNPPLPDARLVIVVPVAVDASDALTSEQASMVPVMIAALLGLGVGFDLVEELELAPEPPHATASAAAAPKPARARLVQVTGSEGLLQRSRRGPRAPKTPAARPTPKPPLARPPHKLPPPPPPPPLFPHPHPIHNPHL